jgi:putative tricarboxylic transport membrane protein
MMWDAMQGGLLQAIQPLNVLAALTGTVLGIIFGALPGLSATTAIALLVPLTFGMPADASLIMLTAIYGGSMFGNAIPAILLHTPGTPASAATLLDGYPMTLKGEGGRALGITAVASTVGGMFSALALLIIAAPLASFALRFGPVEFFWVAIFGLTVVASLSAGNLLKGIIAAACGLLIGTIGMDPFTGTLRFTYGYSGLFEGLGIVPTMIGLFSMSQALVMAEQRWHPSLRTVIRFTWRECIPTFLDIRRLMPAILRSSGIGTIVGILPGAGADIAAWVSYSQERRMSKHPERFGTGVPEGVAAPEAAQNAVTGGTMIPLLTLGIPGSATAAILLGGMLIQGLIPGPRLFTDHAVITYAIIFSFFIANIFMLIIGLLGAGVFQRVNLLPTPVLIAMIVTFSVVGSFAVNNSLFDVWIMLIAGVVGYVMQKLKFSVPAMVLGFILAPIFERNLQRGLDLGRYDVAFFFQSPISLVLVTLTLLALFGPAAMALIRNRRKHA